MSMEQVQKIADVFNEKYMLAVANSDADTYFKAALLGRQLVNALREEGLIQDNIKMAVDEGE